MWSFLIHRHDFHWRAIGRIASKSMKQSIRIWTSLEWFHPKCHTTTKLSKGIPQSMAYYWKYLYVLKTISLLYKKMFMIQGVARDEFDTKKNRGELTDLWVYQCVFWRSINRAWFVERQHKRLPRIRTIHGCEHQTIVHRLLCKNTQINSTWTKGQPLRCLWWQRMSSFPFGPIMVRLVYRTVQQWLYPKILPTDRARGSKMWTLSICKIVVEECSQGWRSMLLQPFQRMKVDNQIRWRYKWT